MGFLLLKQSPVRMADGHKPFSSHSKGCTHRTLLCCLSERIEIGYSPRKDGLTVTRGEDVADGEEEDRKDDEDKVPHNQ